MSYNITGTGSQTFNITHAKHIASKVATDLKRIQRFYGYLSDSWITHFEEELVELLRNGYLDTVTYGFKRGEYWIEPTLRYTAKELGGMLTSDDDPGKVRPGADVSGASFHSFLNYSSAYFGLSSDQRDSFKNSLPFQRTNANEPGISGYFSNDKTYSSGGRALDRSYLKSI